MINCTVVREELARQKMMVIYKKIQESFSLIIYPWHFTEAYVKSWQWHFVLAYTILYSSDIV